MGQDVYEKICASAPVDKTSAMVTSQTGCDDSFLIDGKEKLKALGMQKRHYADLSAKLKDEIGITKKLDRRRVPARIRKHPKYSILLGVMSKLTELDKEITEMRKTHKKIGHEKFAEYFVNKVKEKYPSIYDEIKHQIMKERDQI